MIKLAIIALLAGLSLYEALSPAYAYYCTQTCNTIAGTTYCYTNCY